METRLHPFHSLDSRQSSDNGYQLLARACAWGSARDSRLCVDGSVLHAPVCQFSRLARSICGWFSFRRICKLRFVYIIHSYFLQLCVRFSQLTNKCQFHCWHLNQLIYLRGVSRSDCVSSRYYASSISEALCIDSSKDWETWSIFACWFKFWVKIKFLLNIRYFVWK